MSTRIIGISRRGSRIGVDTGRLAIECEGEKVQVPICELEAIVLSERAVSLSAAALAELAAANVAVTVCDERYRPVGMMQPLVATTVCDFFRKQVEMREPLRKKLCLRWSSYDDCHRNARCSEFVEEEHRRGRHPSHIA